MTAGIPGAGIGGVFYLLSALAAPLWLLVSALTGRRVHAAAWRLAFRHCLLAVTILGAIWLTGWALGHALGSTAGVTTLMMLFAARLLRLLNDEPETVTLPSM